jgi:CBS domain containing-hemolysin-like protein
MNELILPIGIITLLIVLNGLFVAAEFSIVGSARTRLAEMAEEGSKWAGQVLRILQDPNRQNRYLATAQIGITIASLGLGMYGEHTVAAWLVHPFERVSRVGEAQAHTAAAVVAIGLLTYLHVVLGEMIPKSLALTWPERTVLALQPAMTLISRLFYPVVFIVNLSGNAVLRLVGISPAGSGSRVMGPEELELVVEESFAGGLIEAEEQLFIENILDLGERAVGQVMTPRTRITGIPLGSSEEAVLKLVCETGHTRFPVFDGDLDSIRGILHTKALARQQVHAGQEFDLATLASAVMYVPESLSLEQMLGRFRLEGQQIAIVLDEYGGTAGLVTLEDVVEEVVGEILDEFDQEIPPMKALGQGRLRVRGDLLLDELNQHYDLDLRHPDADTVAGLLMAELGRVVEVGDRAVFDGVRFTVESVKRLAVQTVMVELPEPDGEDELE